MTIDKHVAAIRGLLVEHNERTKLGDEEIYHHFANAVATLTKRKFDREKNFNEFKIEYYCIATERGKVHECNCVDVGCDVLKSKVRIPSPINHKSSPFVKVRTLDHQDIAYVDSNVANAINTDPIRKGKLHYSIIGRKIILWNTNGIVPKAILVGGIFEDPLEWEGISLCDENGDDIGKCFDALTQDFPVDQDLVYDAYRMTIALMGIVLRKPEDRINDQG